VNTINIQRGAQAKIGEFWVGVMRVGRPDGINRVQLMIDGPEGSRITILAQGESLYLGEFELKVLSVLDRDKGEPLVEIGWGSEAGSTPGTAPSDS